MSGWSMPCGCCGSASMFGAREIVSITVCLRHMADQNLQVLLSQAANRLYEVIQADPGHLEYPQGWISDKPVG